MYNAIQRKLQILITVGLIWLMICNAEALPLVHPVDLSCISLDYFTDQELDVPDHHGPVFPLPYYLKHFHRLANAVLDTWPDRGFIAIHIWRRPNNNNPHNARIMENILSLAYFYTVDRPWNPYRGSPAVRQRLEAAMEFWVRSQSPDGAFSEPTAQQWRLAPTAFATKFMGQALRLLHNGPPIDDELHRRVIQAQRRAIMHVFTHEPFYEHGKRTSNQYGNAWAGALAYLSLYEDPELRQQMLRRLELARQDFQSPSGYFYEHDGPDWGYNFGTHFSNVHMAWYHTRGTDLAPWLIEGQTLLLEWLSYNAVLQPAGSYFVLNRAIETRTRRPTLERVEIPMGQVIELARAFSPTVDEVQTRRTRIRTELAATWPNVPELREGEFWAFSPYAFLHREHLSWHPTQAQREAALAKLPYLARQRFTHQRADTRHPFVFTYVRRPLYYTVFNAGSVISEQQRLGLGLLWHPHAGTLLQSQTDSLELAWGTRLLDSTEPVVEASEALPRYELAGQPHVPSPGNHDLPDGPLTLRYELEGGGSKTLTFQDQQIRVTVNHPKPYVEQLPLLLSHGDELHVEQDRVRLVRGGFTLEILVRGATTVQRTHAEPETIGSQRLEAIHVHATGRLEYTFRFGSA